MGLHYAHSQTKTTRGLILNEAIVFNTTEYNFGSVPEGTIVEKNFVLTNNGNIPLIINDVETSCGCTVPDYPLDEIAVNASDKIVVKFDTNTKLGEQEKIITVKTNMGNTTLKLKGLVYPKDRNY